MDKIDVKQIKVISKDIIEIPGPGIQLNREELQKQINDLQSEIQQCQDSIDEKQTLLDQFDLPEVKEAIDASFSIKT